MFTSHVPKYFWGDAILTAAYLINRMPSRVLNFQTPLSVLQKSYPQCHLVSNIPLRVFGYSTFVHNLTPHRSKFDPKSIKCIFLGYFPNQKGYKCYSPITRKFYTSMDVTFFENTLYFSETDSGGEF